MEDLIKSAGKSFDLGNYKESIKLYKKLLKKAENFKDKNFFKNRAELSADYYKKVINKDVGEVSFPVYNEAEDNASVITLRITSNPSCTKTFQINNIKTAVKTFLDEFLKDNIKKILVFDWNLDNLTAEIKDIPNSNKNFKKFTNSIEGRSYELAAFIALVSYILKQKVSSKFIFSGAIKIEANKVKLQPVDKISEKLNCIKTERSRISKFIVPAISTSDKEKLLSPKKSIEDILKEVFKNFNKSLETSIRKNESFEKFTLNIFESISEDKQPVLLFKFSHPLNIDDQYVKRIPFYFNNICDELKGKKEGIILDGLRPSYLAPMLISGPLVANHISNFIAVRSGTSTDGVFEKAIVVRTNNNNTSTRNVGEQFLY